MICPRCGTDNDTNGKFCRECGLPLESAIPCTAAGESSHGTSTPPSPPYEKPRTGVDPSPAAGFDAAPVPVGATGTSGNAAGTTAEDDPGLPVSIVGVCLVMLGLNIAGLVCSIIGLTKSSRARKTRPNDSSARASWTLALIGTIFGGLRTLSIAICLLVFGALLTTIIGSLSAIGNDYYDYAYDYGNGSGTYTHDYDSGTQAVFDNGDAYDFSSNVYQMAR